MLIVTGLMLQLPRLRSVKAKSEQAVRTWHTPLIGIVQGIAIAPGISRSGSTISLSLMLGISPQAAAQYSFLLAIPAILGALFIKLKDAGEVTLAAAIVGTLTAFVVGYMALRILLSVLNRGKFYVFFLLLLCGWGGGSFQDGMVRFRQCQIVAPRRTAIQAVPSVFTR